MTLFGNKGPSPQLHKSMPMEQLMRMAGEIEDIAEDAQIRAEQIDDLSADLGVPREKLYVGLGASPHLQLALEHDIQFVVCSGGCQERGALVALGALLDLREERLDEGKSGFDVVPRQCLSRCQLGPVAELRTPDGNAILTNLSAESAAATVAEVMDS